MWKLLSIVCCASVLAWASPPGERVENPVRPVHIIKPPVRCPEGTKPDANGRCRVVWERSADAPCPEGRDVDDDGICRGVGESPRCSGGDCVEEKRVEKRDVEESVREDRTETIQPLGRHRRTEESKTEKKSKRRSDAGDGKAAKQARSKHALIMILKKKKMQMMKPKPPPPPPHHHPPHHSHQESEEEEEPEEPAEEPEQPAGRLFFGDEACIDRENSTEGCRADAEILAGDEANKEFKEWKPEKSSESSESSSSSDSAGESESESLGGSGESEDEVLEKAIKIKLMKLFRMKQRYGPALRRWLAYRLKEYEDSFDD